MLKVNRTLRFLDVSIGGLEVDGFSLLSDALEKNSTLEVLMAVLSNDVDDSRLLALIPGLTLNQGLKWLILRDT